MEKTIGDIELRGFASSKRARSATSSTSATSCSSWPRTASPPSTSSCPRSSPTRERSSPSSRGSGSISPRSSAPTTSSPPRRPTSRPPSGPTPRSSTSGRCSSSKTKVVPIECVVRGYLAGSGWKEYKATGKICGIKIPAGLRESDRLEEPIFTPSTKAEEGHDLNISFKEMQKIVGRRPRPEDQEGVPRALPEGLPARPVQGDHHRRHEVRVRPRRRRARPRRRDLHPRFLALLAAADLRPRQVPAEPGQAVRPGLPGDDRLGQAVRAARPARRRSSTRRPRNTWRSTGSSPGKNDLA